MTGKMPQNLEVTGNPILPNIELKLKPVEGLREDSKKILSKYTTEAEEESTGEWKDNTKTEFYSEVEKEKYREMIPDLEDPVLRNTLSADLIDKIQKVKEDDEKKAVAKVEDKDVKADVSEDLVAVEENKPSFSLFDMLDTTKPRKAEDYIREIYENTIAMNTNLNKLVALESTNGMTQARMVDAANNSAASNAINSRNIISAFIKQSANQTENTASLSRNNNNPLIGVT